MTPLDHSTVGELLGRYIAGELDAETAAAVREHLRACSECRLEEAGLRSLLAPVAAITESERSRLRAGLAAGLASETRAPARVARLRRPFMARLAPALGAAALLAIMVVALTRVDFAGQSGDDSAGARAPRSQAEAGAAQDTTQAAPEALQAELAPITPVFNADAGRFRASELERLGRFGFSGTEPTQESAAVSAGAGTGTATNDAARLGDLDAYRDPMLRALVDEAGEVQVAECANSVFAGGYTRIAPIYGAFGKYDHRRVLVLGFLWSSKDRGPLDSFTIWIWPRNSCSVAVRTFSGTVRR